MLLTKVFEVRDRATFIPVIATLMETDNSVPSERYLLMRAGYGPERCILLTRAEGGESNYDPYNWGRTRTMPAAHQHIIEHWDSLESGSLIDVEFILGEVATPKLSEMFR